MATERAGILIVEDNFAQEGLAIEQCLMRNGYRDIYRAYSREEAVEVALSRRPSVIIMDIDLGEHRKGGVQAARTIGQTYSPGLIYVTGYPTDEFPSQVNQTRPNAVLRKPWDESTLLENVRLAFENTTHLTTVFVSYAHEQRALRDQLVAHLRVLESSNIAEIWADDKLAPGAPWDRVIHHRVATCDIAILLVSREFLDPRGYIVQVELPALIERNQFDGLRLIPVIARPCDWKSNGKLAGLNAWNGGSVIWPQGSEAPDGELALLTERLRQLIQS
jgi:AmiR/NasT family two-component response regulator